MGGRSTERGFPWRIRTERFWKKFDGCMGEFWYGNPGVSPGGVMPINWSGATAWSAECSRLSGRISKSNGSKRRYWPTSSAIGTSRGEAGPCGDSSSLFRVASSLSERPSTGGTNGSTLGAYLAPSERGLEDRGRLVPGTVTSARGHLLAFESRFSNIDLSGNHL